MADPFWFGFCMGIAFGWGCRYLWRMVSHG